MNNIALGRDDVIKVITRNDFYKPNGPFVSLGNLVQELWPAYVKSAEDSSCKCGPDPKILFPALDMLFTLLREKSETGVAARTAFREFMSERKRATVDRVTLYFRRGKEPKPEKVEF